MSAYPIRPLDKVATLIAGTGFPKRFQGQVDGELPFFKVSDISRCVRSGGRVLHEAPNWITEAVAEELKAKRLPKGCIVFARIGEALKLNRRAVLGTDAIVDNNVLGVKAGPDVSDDYLYYFFQTVRLENLSRATTVPAVRSSDVSQIHIPVPNRSTQTEIVNKIDQLFSRIDEGERALRKVETLVERYRQSVLKAAVTGELTRDWRTANRERLQAEGGTGQALLDRILTARRQAWETAELEKLKAKGKTPANDAWKSKYKEPVTPDTDGLPELPEGWVWATIDQLQTEFRNGLSRKPVNAPPGNPILRISAVRELAVDERDIRYYVPKEDEDVSSSCVEPGDFLFTRYNGNPSFVGVAGLFRGPQPVLHPDKLIRFSPVRVDGLVPQFVEVALNSGQTRNHISSRVKTSAGQHGIAGGDIKVAPVPIPPVGEQNVIAARVESMLSQVLHLTTDLSAADRKANSLRQAVLSTAFSGQLIKQDT